MKTSEHYTIAVAGLGRRIATVIRNLAAAAPHIEIVAHADPAPMGLSMLEKRGIGAGAAYESVDAMLAHTKPDLLMVGSPNHLHLAHIRGGLERGLRVFTEKPVVRTEDETWALARLLREHGQSSVIVGLVLRSAPLVAAVTRHLHASKLGRLVSFEGNEHLHPEHGAFLMRDWRRHEAHAGSFLLDKCCHDFDLYRLFAGALPTRVASFGGRDIFTPANEALAERRYPDGTPAYEIWRAGWNGGNSTFQSDADTADNQVALVEYENNVRLTFHANTHAGLPQRRWYFAGTGGALEADLVTNRLTFRDALGINPPETEEFPASAEGHYGSDEQMGRDLAAHLLDGKPFPVAVEDAMIAGLTVMAVDRAMREGGVVDCRPLWERLEKEMGRGR
ncbi:MULTISPECIES: Gfo/Idh/MocA family protein [Alphaproteobacteria]|uniref:Gfo/Idh/MocA family protein n=1 Tax=Alphaproteobacteria TaxID=28211 RepID=UPI00273135EA|nr:MULTISPECIES: Gfo/Idh/MocA family oxidoreductase [Alphaproteobacteria]MDP1626678.1 Gfo/Idh/MocA family oxidoreductase [Parvibaculum sp.]MDP2213891.1 Gfo/Idh/MocA family oxidoreductase [Phenylobacterium sp.]MDP3328491.1 Gfo/Idh/MocA family oxidoreductase [Parvibaculum sp.]